VLHPNFTVLYSEVLPLQPLCQHEQSMSGVFSIASHCVLQYLPDVITHEQTGRAHFSAFVAAIIVLLVSNPAGGSDLEF
jgi:hypothetical protein